MAEQLKLSNQVCFPIYTLAKEVIGLYRPILEQLDLTYPQYLVMLVLWENDHQNVSEIGKQLHLDSGTLTPLLKRLEQKELIERKRSEKDERVVTISLSSNGKSIKENASRVPTEITEKLNVSVSQLEALKESIEIILNQIKPKK